LGVVAVKPRGVSRSRSEIRRQDKVSLSRGAIRPSCAIGMSLLGSRGRRECRVRSAPAATCAAKSTRVSNHRYAAINRHSLRDGLRLISRSSPGTGLFCPRHSRGSTPRKLSASVGRGARTTRFRRPRERRSSSDTTASTASRPTFVTTAKRPSCRGGTAGREHSFWFSEREIFGRGEPTTRISLNRFTKLEF
jgi:hypothetical protein